MVWKKRGRANSCEVCYGAVIVKNNIRSREKIELDWIGRWKNSRRNVKQKEPWDGMHNAEKEEEPGLKMEIKRDATVIGCGAEN
jgi:hypothetical protein